MTSSVMDWAKDAITADAWNNVQMARGLEKALYTVKQHRDLEESRI